MIGSPQAFGTGYAGLQSFGTTMHMAPQMLVPFSGYGAAWAQAVNPLTGKKMKVYPINGKGGFRYLVWKNGDISITKWPPTNVPPANQRYLRKKDHSMRWVAIMGEVSGKVPGGDSLAKAGSIVGDILTQLIPGGTARADDGTGSDGADGAGAGAGDDGAGGPGFMDGPGRYVVYGVGGLVVIGILAAVLK